MYNSSQLACVRAIHCRILASSAVQIVSPWQRPEALPFHVVIKHWRSVSTMCISGSVGPGSRSHVTTIGTGDVAVEPLRSTHG
eukprot:1091610-Rhodomonas_salina.2